MDKPSGRVAKKYFFLSVPWLCTRPVIRFRQPASGPERDLRARKKIPILLCSPIPHATLIHRRVHPARQSFMCHNSTHPIMNSRKTWLPLIITAGLILILTASFLPASTSPVPEIAGVLAAYLIPAAVIYVMYAKMLEWFGSPWTWWKELREGRWEPGWADWATIIIVGLFTCGLAYYSRSVNGNTSWPEFLYDYSLIAIVISGIVIIFVYRWWNEKKKADPGLSLSGEPQMGKPRHGMWSLAMKIFHNRRIPRTGLAKKPRQTNTSHSGAGLQRSGS